jgi:hypothetical protein
MANEMVRPNANIRRQSRAEMAVFVKFFGAGSALITCSPVATLRAHGLGRFTQLIKEHEFLNEFLFA